jgi:hypothetical protein
MNLNIKNENNFLDFLSPIINFDFNKFILLENFFIKDLLEFLIVYYKNDFF